MPTSRSTRQKTSPFSTAFGSRTDIGCVRDKNEDSLIVSPPLYAVADGMGGHAAGDVASEVAIRVLTAQAPTEADVDALGDAVIAANHAVIEEANRAKLEGMGTTMTAAILDGERLAIAHVGDSRAYLLHHGKLQQITRDHSLMADMIEAGRLTPEEARNHPNRSIITRALGSDPDMRPDLYELTASAGDRLLLCSDGLSSMVDDEQIANQLSRIRDPQRCASALVNDAIAAGGLDNITVIVVDVAGDEEVRVKKGIHRTRAWVVAILVALVCVFGAAGYFVFNYTQNSAYLIAEDGVVAVYRGLPDNFFGMEFSEFDHRTNVTVTDLPAGTQLRLEQGIQTDSLEAAKILVENYEREIAEHQQVPGRNEDGDLSSSSSAAVSSSALSNATANSGENGVDRS